MHADAGMSQTQDALSPKLLPLPEGAFCGFGSALMPPNEETVGAWHRHVSASRDLLPFVGLDVLRLSLLSCQGDSATKAPSWSLVDRCLKQIQALKLLRHTQWPCNCNARSATAPARGCASRIPLRQFAVRRGLCARGSCRGAMILAVFCSRLRASGSHTM